MAKRDHYRLATTTKDTDMCHLLFIKTLAMFLIGFHCMLFMDINGEILKDQQQDDLCQTRMEMNNDGIPAQCFVFNINSKDEILLYRSQTDISIFLTNSARLVVSVFLHDGVRE